MDGVGASDILDSIIKDAQSEKKYDYITIYESLNMTDTIINQILGIIAMILVVGNALIVAFEVFYLNNPLLNSTLNKVIEARDAGFVSKALQLTLRDAVEAIRRANTVDTGKSVNAVYLSIKWKRLVIVFIIVGILTGPGNAIINYFATQIKRILGLVL